VYHRVALGSFILLVAFSINPVAIAKTDGADSGSSGGHVGGGVNCTLCHGYNSGPGGVQLRGVPRRYLPNGIYDLTVRVFDAEQVGAGFQISAESPAGHEGLFVITDAANTQYADSPGPSPYVTHTRDGVNDSISTWDANGGSYTFHFRWVAPAQDAGPVTFFTAGNAIDGQAVFGDRYYATYAIANFADVPDADGDSDVDISDFAAYQRCFDADDPATPPSCEFVDEDLKTFLSLLEGPTATLPAGYVLADPVRGGLLYDEWWAVNGAPTPTGDHPLYPAVGQQTGSSTFRCKECHGWDYKGALGDYAPGSSHYTGIRGVFGTSLGPQDLFHLLKADPTQIPNGHNMDAYGMSDDDLWDVVRMTLESVVLTDVYIDSNTGAFRPDPGVGLNLFNENCAFCHGFEGDDINFGSAESPEYIGGLARRNPWEFLHKTRFSHPASPMPASDLLLWDVFEAASVGAYSATLQP